MDVVAEGIETIAQLEKLQLLGCDLGQGYFFSKPLNSEMTTKFLTEGAFQMDFNMGFSPSIKAALMLEQSRIEM